MMENKLGAAGERDYYYDNMKLLLIFLVVWGHMLPICGSLFGNALALTIYTFHMPLFVFVTGYFSRNTAKNKKRALDILKIYFVVRIVCAVIDRFMTGSYDSLKTILSPNNSLWYLVAVFWWRYFSEEMIKVRGIALWASIISVLLVLQVDINNFLGIRRTLAFLPFFVFGLLIDEQTVLKIRSINKFLSIAVLMGIFAASYLWLRRGGDWTVTMVTLQRGTTYGDFSNLFVGVLVWLLLLPLSMISSACVSSLVPRKKLIISSWGRYTLPVYIGTTYLAHIFMYAIDKVGGLEPAEMLLSATFLSVISVAIICYLSKVVSGKLARVKKVDDN
ncbi:Fucose 4-O-acetylase [Butyrivibrio sp. ob235]|uniref:acyltransferase family protein n=1 Tax=Butyrivibrio sp. ob235 TaxID=1761780 RepID=UPI0008BA3853|nr:acyltransferase family protein [Butyrivibrio sp. ob235]SEM26221.1 Fucose 4-O-acetylase [Butyrivibrio sp. ob235]